MKVFKILLSILYISLINIRNWLYDIGFLTAHNFSTPIISIGNITAGGNGKTPMVVYIAKKLIDNAKEIKCDHGNCWTEVNDLEIYEMTLCVAPMNPKSYITDIVQKPDPQICPECYEYDQLEYDSSLKVI